MLSVCRVDGSRIKSQTTFGHLFSSAASHLSCSLSFLKILSFFDYKPDIGQRTHSRSAFDQIYGTSPRSLSHTREIVRLITLQFFLLSFFLSHFSFSFPFFLSNFYSPFDIIQTVRGCKRTIF